jgi:predicted ester cyclase
LRVIRFLDRRQAMSEIASAGADRATGTAQLDRAERWAARMLEVWNSHDTTDPPDLATADVVSIDPALAEPANGVATVRRFMEDSWRAVPDLRFEVTGSRCFADDAPVLMVPWRMTGTQLGPVDPPGYAPTGRRIEVEGVDVYAFRGERVADYRACYDNLAVARQLGLLPTPGSRGEHLLAAAQRAPARLRRPRG